MKLHVKIKGAHAVMLKAIADHIKADNSLTMECLIESAYRAMLQGKVKEGSAEEKETK